MLLLFLLFAINASISVNLHLYSPRCIFLYFFLACNVLSVSTTEPFTLRNYGRRNNCTLTAVYPGIVNVIALGVGDGNSQDVVHTTETGTLHKVRNKVFLSTIIRRIITILNMSFKALSLTCLKKFREIYINLFLNKVISFIFFPVYSIFLYLFLKYLFFLLYISFEF